jgi:hypothetical protein
MGSVWSRAEAAPKESIRAESDMAPEKECRRHIAHFNGDIIEYTDKHIILSRIAITATQLLSEGKSVRVFGCTARIDQNIFVGDIKTWSEYATHKDGNLIVTIAGNNHTLYMCDYTPESACRGPTCDVDFYYDYDSMPPSFRADYYNPRLQVEYPHILLRKVTKKGISQAPV